MDAASIRSAGLPGWRGTVANAVAGPVAKRSSASEDQVRTAVSILFLVLTLVSVLRTIKRLLEDS
jgi:hypothetical protein